MYVERDSVCEKRPTCEKRERNMAVIRHSIMCGKRPVYLKRVICIWKETY